MTVSPLSLFDNDLTYDLIFAQKIDQELNDLIAIALGDHSPFQVGKKLTPMLCDRFTPSDYSWANDWTTKIFEFLKKLSLTFIWDDEILTGKAYGLTPPYTWVKPSSISLSSFPTEVTLNIPKKSQVTITWSEIAEQTEFYSRWEKVSKQFIGDEKQNTIVNLNCENWLFNSAVITGGTLSGNTTLLLYANLDATLGNIIGQCNLPNWQALTRYTLKYPTLEAKDPTYSNLPDWAHFASLYYASNNHWKNTDLGNRANNAGEPKRLGRTVFFKDGLPQVGWQGYPVFPENYTMRAETINFFTLPDTYKDGIFFEMNLSMMGLNWQGANVDLQNYPFSYDGVERNDGFGELWGLRNFAQGLQTGATGGRFRKIGLFPVSYSFFNRKLPYNWFKEWNVQWIYYSPYVDNQSTFTDGDTVFEVYHIGYLKLKCIKDLKITLAIDNTKEGGIGFTTSTLKYISREETTKDDLTCETDLIFYANFWDSSND